LPAVSQAFSLRGPRPINRLQPLENLLAQFAFLPLADWKIGDTAAWKACATADVSSTPVSASFGSFERRKRLLPHAD
jgi:hypothetical protein